MTSKIPVVKRNAFTYLMNKDIRFQQLRKKTLKGIRCAPDRDYSYTKGTLLPAARRHLEKLAKTEKRIHFLDAGAGMGYALKAAEWVNPFRIRAHGMALNKPEEKAGIPQNNWTRSHFETTVFPGRFHVIQSSYGIQHAVNYAMAIENLLNSLRPKGKLFVHENAYNTPHATICHLPEYARRELLETLNSQGFSYEHEYRPGGEDLEIFTKRGRTDADLSAFYESNVINSFPIRKDVPKQSPHERTKPKRKA